MSAAPGSCSWLSSGSALPPAASSSSKSTSLKPAEAHCALSSAETAPYATTEAKGHRWIRLGSSAAEQTTLAICLAQEAMAARAPEVVQEETQAGTVAGWRRRKAVFGQAARLRLALNVRDHVGAERVVHGHDDDARLVTRLRHQHPLGRVLAVQPEEAQALGRARHQLKLPERRCDRIDPRADLGVALPAVRPDAPVWQEAVAEAGSRRAALQASLGKHLVDVLVVGVLAARDQLVRRERRAQHGPVGRRRADNMSPAHAGVEARRRRGVGHAG